MAFDGTGNDNDDDEGDQYEGHAPIKHEHYHKSTDDIRQTSQDEVEVIGDELFELFALHTQARA